MRFIESRICWGRADDFWIIDLKCKLGPVEGYLGASKLQIELWLLRLNFSGGIVWTLEIEVL